MSDTVLLRKSKPEPVRRLEVFTGAGRRRVRRAEQKAGIIAESYEGGEWCGRGASVIEIVVGALTVRVAPGTDAATLATVLRAVQVGMIAFLAGIRVLVASKPVDFRRGADSLAALVQEQLPSTIRSYE